MRNTTIFAIVAGLFLSALIISNVDTESLRDLLEEASLLSNDAYISEEEFEREFMNFVAKYGKSYYNSFEFNDRYEIFRDNYQQIVNHNVDEEEYGFSLGVNKFADLTLEEFKQNWLGVKGSLRRPSHLRPKVSFNGLRDLPAKVDWRTNGNFVNKVKNQGSCGSCWAFSAIGAIESAFAIKTGTLPSLSEQQLVECSKGYGNGGCSGGFMEYGFRYAEDHALCTEEQYPYLAKDSPACTHEKCEGNPYKLTGFTDVIENDRDQLYAALAQQPVSIGVCAGSLGWQFYKSGVLSWFCGDCLDHGVISVGYGNDKGDYVIVRNSWGQDWGEKGYLRISSKDKKGKGTCGIYQLPSVPIV